MNIQLDDGLQFGLGVFETIRIRSGQPEFLDWHIERMNQSLQALHIPQEVSAEEAAAWLKQQKELKHSDENRHDEMKAMKILVTEKNKLMMLRSNPYTPERIRQGFCLDYSAVIRNETSPLVYHKTLNYGDNILEKRRTSSLPVDERIFLNTRGELTEGSTTNIFFVFDGRLVTPTVSCGLLNGIMRRFVLENFPCKETVLYPEDVLQADECFVTNSLMGIMPVKMLAGTEFPSAEITNEILYKYQMKSYCER
ncbi:MAG: aminotransferase class IV [Lachnospiraceae bacterium]|nr:aminotransferase class IV [Lachnospiraceae bacterium]